MPRPTRRRLKVRSSEKPERPLRESVAAFLFVARVNLLTARRLSPRDGRAMSGHGRYDASYQSDPDRGRPDASGRGCGDVAGAWRRIDGQKPGHHLGPDP